MMRSLASVPIAENISANFVTSSALFLLWAIVIFRYLQKYECLSSNPAARGGKGYLESGNRRRQAPSKTPA